MLKEIKDLDGPTGLPIVGNFFQFKPETFHLQVEQWCDKFGPLFKFTVGPVKIVCVADPDAINDMLRARPEGFRRRSTIENIISEMGFNGVFSSEGENWRRQRRVVAQALNSAHLLRFHPKLVQTTKRLLGRLTSAANENSTVNLCRMLMRYTVDVTSLLAFGLDVNTLETEGAVIQQQLDKVFPMLGRRVNAPFGLWRIWRTKQDKELLQALAFLEKEINEIIAQCRERMDKHPSLYDEPNNFLEAIIAAQKEQDSNFSDQDIYANVLTLLLAGEDTTANTIAWAIKFFIDYPALYQRAQEEVDRVIGNESLPMQYEQLGSFDFIEACANETLRLKPVAPLNALESNQEYELLGVRIPKGTPILALTRHTAINSEYFAEPDRFDPDRWLNGEHANTHNPKAYLPFGTGPRFCPGRNLALVEIKMALAMICRNFELTLDETDGPVEERLAFTMFPANLAVKFSPRQ